MIKAPVFSTGVFFSIEYQVDTDEMADASGHYEQMKDLVRSPWTVSLIEAYQFESINDTAYSVDHTSGIQPYESGSRYMADKMRHGKYHYPSHRYINGG